MYSWSRQQVVLSQAIHADPQMKKMFGGVIQIPCQFISSKIRMEYDAYSLSWSLLIIQCWFCWPSNNPVGKHACWWQEYSTRGQTLWRSIQLLKLILKHSAFSDTCKLYPFPCKVSKHLYKKVLLLRCKHYMTIQAVRHVRFKIITFP